MTAWKKCYARPNKDSPRRCTRPVGHKDKHVDSKVGRYEWEPSSADYYGPPLPEAAQNQSPRLSDPVRGAPRI